MTICNINLIMNLACGRTDLSKAHVLLDGIDTSLEVGSGSVHVGDHGADVADDGGEDQHAHLEKSEAVKTFIVTFSSEYKPVNL